MDTQGDYATLEPVMRSCKFYLYMTDNYHLCQVRGDLLIVKLDLQLICIILAPVRRKSVNFNGVNFTTHNIVNVGLFFGIKDLKNTVFYKHFSV